MKKILIAITSHATHASGAPTGYWLSELTHFYAVAKKHGYTMDMISTQGGEVPMDPASNTLKDIVNAECMNDPEFIHAISHTRRAEEVRASDYDAIYYPGGHGPLWDLNTHPTIAHLAASIYENGGIVSAVCHGPAGLLPIVLSDGSALLTGKTVTGFSILEEKLSRKMKEVPFVLEKQLREKSGHYTRSRIPFRVHIEIDGRLITGQNPQSAHAVAEAVINTLNRR